jgi:hypothetical protein
MPDLVVVTPSRARPHNVDRLWTAMQKTCKADTRLLIGLDSDDETRPSYPRGPKYMRQDGLQGKVVEWINLLAVAAVLSPAPAVGHFGDDCLPRTDGWDEKILAALEKAPFAFGNDLSIERPPGSLCTHLFMRSEVFRTLGYFGPPSIQHMWVDLAWMAWGEAAGMTYLDEVVIEHLHFMEGKALYDASYHASRQQDRLEQDLRALWEYVRDGLNADIQKLRPGAGHVSPWEFLQASHVRGAPVPVPAGYEQLAGRR